MPSHMRAALLAVATLCLAFGDGHYFAIKEGNEKFRNKDYKGALELYKKANGQKDSAVSRYDMGNAQYWLGDYNAAAEAYGGAVNSPDADLAKRAALNYANAKTSLAMEKMEKGPEPTAREDLESAIAAYRKVLLDAPSNNSAKHNMEIAMKKLQELRDQEKKDGDKEKKEGKQEQPKNDKQNGDDKRQARQDKEMTQQEKQEKIKKGEGEKLLKNLSNEEEKVQKQLRRYNMPEKEVEKDW